MPKTSAMNVIQFGLKIHHGQPERNYSLQKSYFGNHICTPLIVAELLELTTVHFNTFQLRYTIFLNAADNPPSCFASISLTF